MGMNFYIRNRNGIWEKKIHIGKWSGDTFIWAITEEKLYNYFDEIPGLIIINDSGSANGLLSFMELIKDKIWDFEMVGKDFC